MQALFYADGQGVSAKHLDAAVSDVRDIVRAMGEPTGILCDCMDRAAAGLGPDPRGKQPRVCSDTDVLLCILSHRADRIASKYLKEKQHMPKMDGKRKGLIF